MDYQTKPTSRRDLRRFSRIMRKLFGISQAGNFPVLQVLDKICDVFKGSSYEIVEDSRLPPKVMAQCSANDQGGFTIEIKETVYNGAYENQNGAFLGFICHEICHVFLFYIGFTPNFDRSFKPNELPAYRSVEWQAKALCAEVMIPFNESEGMSVAEIVNKYHVSKAFAQHRRKLSKGGNYAQKNKH